MKTNRIKVVLSLNKQKIADLENEKGEVIGAANFTGLGSMWSFTRIAHCGNSGYNRSTACVRKLDTADGDSDSE